MACTVLPFPRAQASLLHHDVKVHVNIDFLYYKKYMPKNPFHKSYKMSSLFKQNALIFQNHDLSTVLV